MNLNEGPDVGLNDDPNDVPYFVGQPDDPDFIIINGGFMGLDNEGNGLDNGPNNVMNDDFMINPNFNQDDEQHVAEQRAAERNAANIRLAAAEAVLDAAKAEEFPG